MHTDPRLIDEGYLGEMRGQLTTAEREMYTQGAFHPDNIDTK